MLHDFWNGLLDRADYYAVNPAIFIALYLITWPQVWYSWYLLVRSYRRNDKVAFRRAIWYNRVVTFAPYIYVLVWGRNFPQWLIPSSIAFMVALTLVFKYQLGHGLLLRLAAKVDRMREKLSAIRMRFVCKSTRSR